jgi:hypothetical protein
MKDLKGVVNGKTLTGVLLGIVVAITMVYTDVKDILPWIPPDILDKILLGIPALLTLFGLWDAGNDSFANIKQQIKDFIASSPGYGVALQVLVAVLDGLPGLGGIPEWILGISYIVSSALVIFGLKANTIKARQNMAALPDNYKDSYKKAA